MAALAAAILLAVASPAPFTVYGDRTVAGFPLTGSPARARAFFGPPRQTHARKPYECIQSWGLFRLTIDFFAFQGNPCVAGEALTMTVTNPRWHTWKGLGIGNPTARIRALYPAARPHGGEWWLIVRHACKETGGAAYGSLVARTLRGRVSALVVSGALCE